MDIWGLEEFGQPFLVIDKGDITLSDALISLSSQIGIANRAKQYRGTVSEGATFTLTD